MLWSYERMYDFLCQFYSHVFIIVYVIWSCSCGVLVHMMLLFVKGSIVCSESGHYILEMAHVHEGNLISLIHFIHTLLAL